MKVFFEADSAQEVCSIGVLLRPGVNEVGEAQAETLLELGICRPATSNEEQAFDAEVERQAAEQKAKEEEQAEAVPPPAAPRRPSGRRHREPAPPAEEKE